MQVHCITDGMIIYHEHELSFVPIKTKTTHFTLIFTSKNNEQQVGDGESFDKGGQGSGKGDCPSASCARASPGLGLGGQGK